MSDFLHNQQSFQDHYVWPSSLWKIPVSGVQCDSLITPYVTQKAGFCYSWDYHQVTNFQSYPFTQVEVHTLDRKHLGSGNSVVDFCPPEILWIKQSCNISFKASVSVIQLIEIMPCNLIFCPYPESQALQNTANTLGKQNQKAKSLQDLQEVPISAVWTVFLRAGGHLLFAS